MQSAEQCEQSFREWKAGRSEGGTTFNMPDEALAHLFLPPKLRILLPDTDIRFVSGVKTETNLCAVVADGKKFDYQYHYRWSEHLAKVNGDDYYMPYGGLLYVGAQINQIDGRPALRINDLELVDPLQRNGVCTEFYTRLRQELPPLGYWMTYGFNGEDNIDFFGRKLGRTALNQVKPDLRSVLMPDRDIDDEDFLQYYTFDFFDPKDAVRFRL